ncbi:hypothetical protein SKAU_G00240360 [Synaphobranchus kaupii]|uniref:Fibronectin type-III domain-containing protein n=1 Tax=Synaphobranchus kaupii TaxID=118154 RepID=A0A9Q1F7L0_SYNKA|nr:hypothetical protein SKAU_G00240360 [Synaphobranchus kaupii]
MARGRVAGPCALSLAYLCCVTAYGEDGSLRLRGQLSRTGRGLERNETYPLKSSGHSQHSSTQGHTAHGTPCSSPAYLHLRGVAMPPRLTMLFLLLLPVVHCTLLAPLNVSIVSFNLEHILHWLPAPGTPVTTQFRVHCLHLSEVSWKPVPWCLKVDTETLSCDMTESFLDSSSFYIARVQAFSSPQRSNWTLSAPFNPILDTVLGPPQVSVSGCGSCLRLQITPPTGRGPQNLLSPHLLSEFTCWVRRSGEHAQFSLRVSSSEELLVEYLEPGVEYCVTAAVTVNFNTRAVPSQPQCAYTSPPPINTVPALLGALCVTCLLGVLFCSFLFSSRGARYLPKTLPRILLSIPSLIQTPHTAAPEPFSLVTILPLERTNFPSSWAPLGPNADQEEEEEDEKEGYGHIVAEAISEPCNDALLDPQCSQVEQ